MKTFTGHFNTERFKAIAKQFHKEPTPESGFDTFLFIMVMIIMVGLSITG